MKHVLSLLLFFIFTSSPSCSPIANNKPISVQKRGNSTKKSFLSTITSFFSPQMQRNFIENNIKQDQSIFLILLFAFLAGLLASLTPCVYPLIPITSSIMQAQATRSKTYNFFLSLSYVLGTAVAYGLLGFLVTSSKWLFGRQVLFGQWLSSPIFMIVVIAFFLYFAFAMLGFYDIYIPRFLQQRRMVKINGSLFYSFVSGIIAGTIASPCTGPILGALILIAMQLNNPLFAFATFFAFALGMGILLLIVGNWATMLETLPKAGPWMREIKKIFGFGLLGTCIYLLSLNKTLFIWLSTWLPLSPGIIQKNIVLLLIALLLLVAGLYYLVNGWQNKGGHMISSPLSLKQISSYPKNKKRQKKVSILGLVKIVIGLLLITYSGWILLQIYALTTQNTELLHALYHYCHTLTHL